MLASLRRGDVVISRETPAAEARVTVRFGGSGNCPVVSSWTVETPAPALGGMGLVRSAGCW
jgi:hypothetical protein